MIHKRQGFAFRTTALQDLRMVNGECPNCGKSKDDWKRRTDWRCCSKECTEKFDEGYYLSWPSTRMKAIERDNFTCVKCGYKGSKLAPYLVGDHIIPIALGGDEFDVDNVQTLCVPCDKIKTKQDSKDIALRRRQIKHGVLPL